MNEHNIKVAVCTQSYYRKDGSTKKYLQNMFKMLENQTYKNFKIFITGDNYKPEKEFVELCQEYKGELQMYNNNYAFRDFNLGNILNYWACGGLSAAYNSYIKAKEGGYDIALMLDDDDIWTESHIDNVVSNFIKYPETAFMIVKSEYRSKASNQIKIDDSYSYLPRSNINNIHYNNYIPVGCDSVRSASIHNLNIIYEDVIKLWDNIIENIKNINLKGGEERSVICPCDAALLNLIGKNVKQGKYKSLYIPIVSVKKISDGNWHNIK